MERLWALYQQWCHSNEDRVNDRLMMWKDGEGELYSNESCEEIAIWESFEEGYAEFERLLYPPKLSWVLVTLSVLKEHYPSIYQEYIHEMESKGIADTEAFHSFSLRIDEEGRVFESVIGRVNDVK